MRGIEAATAIAHMLPAGGLIAVGEIARLKRRRYLVVIRIGSDRARCRKS